MVRVVGVGGLRDLEVEVPVLQAVFCDKAVEQGGELRVEHVHAREVHRHRQRHAVALAPGGDLLCRALPYKAVEQRDLPAALEELDEAVGGDKAELRMPPAHQRLGARKSRRVLLDIVLGLVIDLQLAVLQRAREIRAQPLVKLLVPAGLLVIDHEVGLEVAPHHAARKPRLVKHHPGRDIRLPGHHAHAHLDIRACDESVHAALEALEQGIVFIPVRAVDVEVVPLDVAADALRLREEGGDLAAQGVQDLVAVRAAVQGIDHVEAVDVHDDGVHGLAGMLAVIAVGIHMEEAAAVELCGQGVKLRLGDDLPPLLHLGLGMDVFQKQKQNEAAHHRHDGDNVGNVILEIGEEGDPLVAEGVVCERGVQRGGREQMVYLVEDGEQTVVPPVHGEGEIHRVPGGERSELVFRHQIAHAVEAVIAHKGAVRLPLGHRAEAGVHRVVGADRPVREIVLQKGHMAGVPLEHRDGHLPLGRDALPVRGPCRGEHFGGDKGVCDDDAALLPVVGGEVHGEDAVELPGGESVQRPLRGGVGARFKADLRVFLRGLGKLEIIGKRALQRAALIPPVAVGEKIVPVAHADGPVPGEPVLLLQREEAVDGPGPVELLGELLVVVAVILEDAVHRHVELALEIGAVFIDAEVGVRGPHLAHGDHVGGIAVGVERDQHVELPGREHLQKLRGLGRELNDLGVHVVLCRPVDEELLLNAVLVHAETLAVEGGKIVGPDLGICGGDEDMVILRPHALGGVEDLFRPRLGIGHVAQDIQLARDEHLQKLRPAPLHIFIGPAGVGRDALLILIAVAGAAAELIRPVEGRLVPADAHRLRLGLRGENSGGGEHHQHRQQAQHTQAQFLHRPRLLSLYCARLRWEKIPEALKN